MVGTILSKLYVLVHLVLTLHEVDTIIILAV